MDPTLNQLKTFIDQQYSILSFEQRNSITYYYNQSMQTWSSLHFYLHGQLKIHVDTPITEEIIQLSIQKHNDSFAKYGGPCNSIEAASIQNNIITFNSFVSAIQTYKIHFN